MITCDNCGSENTMDGWATEDPEDNTRVWVCLDCGARGVEDLESDDHSQGEDRQDEPAEQPTASAIDMEQLKRGIDWTILSWLSRNGYGISAVQP